MTKTQATKWRKSLLAYIRFGSYGIAAKELRMNKSTLVMHLAKLEAQVGQVVERNELGYRTPVLNEYGKDWLTKYNQFPGGGKRV